MTDPLSKAVVVSLMSGVAPFALAAPLLSDINADIGPSADIEWVGFAYNLVLACTLSLVGRLSDIFGRRWFFICGNFLALVGTVICATAVNVPMLIGGMAIASLGVATQISFQYVLGELVPVGKRFIVMSTVFPWSIPLVRNPRDKERGREGERELCPGIPPNPLLAVPGVDQQSPQTIGRVRSRYFAGFPDVYGPPVAMVLLAMRNPQRLLHGVILLLLPPAHLPAPRAR